MHTQLTHHFKCFKKKKIVKCRICDYFYKLDSFYLFNFFFFPHVSRFRSWSRRYSGHCTVLVLIGSRLFAPTFLLRLTTHERSSHMEPRPDHVTLSITARAERLRVLTVTREQTRSSPRPCRTSDGISIRRLAAESGVGTRVEISVSKLLNNKNMKQEDLGQCIHVVGKL